MPSLNERGKPHIFLLDSPDREKKHAENFTSRAEALVEYGSLVDILFRVVETKELGNQDLQALANLLESRFNFVWEAAGKRMVQCAHYFPEAGTKLVALMGHLKAALRLRVVQSLWTDVPPTHIAAEIISMGLRDKNAKVRVFAEDRKHRVKG